MKVCNSAAHPWPTAARSHRWRDIVSSDASRAYVIVSAPGKRTPADVKVTDALYACAREKNEKGNCDETFAVIEKRFLDIESELGIKVGMKDLLAEIKERSKPVRAWITSPPAANI